MKHFRTNDFLEAVQELARTHSPQYAESCARAALRNHLVSFQQFAAALQILHKVA